jgi:transposase
MEIEEALFMEDLNPKHSLRCHISQETAEEIGYNIIKHYTLSSPDLNPIEHVWSLLKTSVVKINPTTLEEL